MTELWNRLRSAWGDLSLRERALVSAAAGTLGAILFYLTVVNPFVSAASRAHARVDAAELQLETITRLDREYQEVAARMASVEKRIRENRSRQNVLTLLESLASKSSVKIDSMQE